MEDFAAAARKKSSDNRIALGACGMLVIALALSTGISIWGLAASGWTMPVDSESPLEKNANTPPFPPLPFPPSPPSFL